MEASNSPTSPTTLKESLAAIDQQQVLRFYDQLESPARTSSARQLLALDLGEIDELAEKHVRHKSPIPLPKNIEPVKAYPREPAPGQEQLYADARSAATSCCKQGKVAAFLVAGGQGTRLGYDGPKGEFPVTPIKNKPLFQVFAEQLLAHSRDAGKPIPWYIMTSDVNDAATRAFFKKNNYFGYDPADVFFFQQGMMPAFAHGRQNAAGREGFARALARRSRRLAPRARQERRAGRHEASAASSTCPTSRSTTRSSTRSTRCSSACTT